MTGKIKAFCCWSGGKESVLSFYKAKKQGIEISYLINMISEDGEYSRTHGISSDLLRLQADSIGIPILQRRTTWGTYEQEFKSAIKDLKKENIQTGVFGDIDLEEHRDWVERVCKEIGVQPILPLWKEKRQVLLEGFIKAGFNAIVVATNADFLGEEWLGREINKEFIEELKFLGTIDLCGEKGEYHSFVYNGPIFKKSVEFSIGEKRLKDKHWFLEIIAKDDTL